MSTLPSPKDLTTTYSADEDVLWKAVQRRDSNSDGMFVYAVESTGIYCRPSCPSRKPERQHVQFFPAPNEAERAGFRACKRCQPDRLQDHIKLVQDVCHYIDERAEDIPTLAELGEEFGLSPYHLQRMFKRATGLTPKQYADARRTERLKTMLKEREDIATTVYEAGFGSMSRVYERAPEQLGMTPGAYRRGGVGMHIHYTITDSALGRLLVGATERGVCAVSLGDDDAALEAALHDEYPAAEVTRDDTISPWVEAILRYLNGQLPHLELPVDIQTTAFRWKVLQELQRIPAGETRSYAEIARAIGQPKAVRAVASACATNPVALVIPCHRVVRSDGQSGGYRWGAERKQHLLQQERDASHTA